MKLDLHGIRHNEVERKLDSFFWESMQRNISQVEVVTGISNRMKSIVEETCKDYGFSVNERYYNPGSLIIDIN